jgi:allophanate hydrolase
MRSGRDLACTVSLAELAGRYRAGVHPAEVVEGVLGRIASRGEDHVWITLRPAASLVAEAEGLVRRWPDPRARPPLFGVPFAVKDNIDVAGLPTTAGCPGYAYLPAASAPLVTRLQEAGAVLVGKTNLDQFATGLSGTRSPYGACESPLVPGLISGGSSSGSAVAVAAGLVPVAIGTDTAGSGRVPAALTGTFGVKPSRGLVSTLGVVPACASLDCPSVFAGSAADALAVLAVIAGHEPEDPWSRRLPVPSGVAGRPVSMRVPSGVAGRPVPMRIGVPRELDFHGDEAARTAFLAATARLADLGHRLVRVDLDPFLAAGSLLYDGPWIAERLAAVGDFADSHPDQVHPVTLQVLRGGRGFDAVDAFRGLHRLRELRAQTGPAWAAMDVLAVPTVPTTFTIAEMLADPIGRNTVLGRYTTFANLLDLAAVAVPCGFTSAGRPHGITLLAPAGGDAMLAALAATLGLPYRVHGRCATGGGPVSDGRRSYLGAAADGSAARRMAAAKTSGCSRCTACRAPERCQTGRPNRAASSRTDSCRTGGEHSPTVTTTGPTPWVGPVGSNAPNIARSLATAPASAGASARVQALP